MFVREEYFNETRGYRFGSSDWYEAYTDDVGKLFRDMQREFGRCRGKVYVDLPDGTAKQVGWTFEKKMQYEDYRGHGERYYVRTVWVSLADRVERVPGQVNVDYATVGK